jgi:hypothetical protein
VSTPDAVIINGARELASRGEVFEACLTSLTLEAIYHSGSLVGDESGVDPSLNNLWFAMPKRRRFSRAVEQSRGRAVPLNFPPCLPKYPKTTLRAVIQMRQMKSSMRLFPGCSH